MLEIKLVLATHNLHKQKEMNSILSSLEIHIVGLDEFPQIGDIEETGTTLIENAFIIISSCPEKSRPCLNLPAFPMTPVSLICGIIFFFLKKENIIVLIRFY